MSFDAAWFLLLLPLALVPLWLERREGHMYSWVALAPQDKLSDLAGWLLRLLSVMAIALLVLALAGPRGPEQQIARLGKGAQTVLVIDRSASMDDPFAGSEGSRRAGESKSAAARRLIAQFIDWRPDDMVGVVAFSNSAMHAIPLTQSREAIHAAIDAATGSGLLQTNIGAGLTTGVAMFEKVPDSGSRAIVLLSDGAGRISPKAKQKIADWLAREHVNLYWIVLRQPDGISIFNPQTQLANDGLEPAEIELHKFFQALRTQYRAYEADNPGALESAMHDIDRREKKPIRYTERIPGRDYTDACAMLAALLIGLLLTAKHMGARAWQAA